MTTETDASPTSRRAVPLSTRVARGRMVIVSQIPRGHVAIVPMAKFAAGSMAIGAEVEGARSFTWHRDNEQIPLGHGDDADAYALAEGIARSVGHLPIFTKAGNWATLAVVLLALGLGITIEQAQANRSAAPHSAVEMAAMSGDAPATAPASQMKDLFAQAMHARVDPVASTPTAGLPANGALHAVGAPTLAPSPARTKSIEPSPDQGVPRIATAASAAPAGPPPTGKGTDTGVFVPLDE